MDQVVQRPISARRWLPEGCLSPCLWSVATQLACSHTVSHVKYPTVLTEQTFVLISSVSDLHFKFPWLCMHHKHLSCSSNNYDACKVFDHIVWHGHNLKYSSKALYWSTLQYNAFDEYFKLWPCRTILSNNSYQSSEALNLFRQINNIFVLSTFAIIDLRPKSNAKKWSKVKHCDC